MVAPTAAARRSAVATLGGEYSPCFKPQDKGTATVPPIPVLPVVQLVNVWMSSQRLQILHQCILVFVRQFSPERVALVAAGPNNVKRLPVPFLLFALSRR